MIEDIQIPFSDLGESSNDERDSLRVFDREYFDTTLIPWVSGIWIL